MVAITDRQLHNRPHNLLGSVPPSRDRAGFVLRRNTMRETILLFTNLKEPLDALTDEQAGKLLKAIFAYQAGEKVNLDGLLNVVFLQIKQQIDYNNERYEEKTRKLSEAGKKGMQSRWNKDNEVITKDNEVITKDKVVIKVNNKNNLNVNDNVIVNENETVNGNENKSAKALIEEVINAWNAMPNRGIIPKVTSISSGSLRWKMLKARIEEHGIDKVLEAINVAGNSSFLKNAEWFCLDWFVKPNNFVKVLEGNYRDKAKEIPRAFKAIDDMGWEDDGETKPIWEVLK